MKNKFKIDLSSKGLNLDDFKNHALESNLQAAQIRGGERVDYAKVTFRRIDPHWPDA
ncbi:hypothetical protein GCM10022393_14140 [Aquimarina addita]|uniref:Uncharacterized protein n=1 Tax=Aquimarina addita TaxID=870485 RepID=A0ABP7XFE4_9FLAO